MGKKRDEVICCATQIMTRLKPKPTVSSGTHLLKGEQGKKDGAKATYSQAAASRSRCFPSFVPSPSHGILSHRYASETL